MPPSDVPGSRRLPALRLTHAEASPAETARVVPEEVPVALVQDGSTHAVMLATPADLEDFAVGFALTEGIVTSLDEIAEGPEVVRHPDGWETRLWLRPEASGRQRVRRRAITGPTGCGLCGIDSLETAVPVPPRVTADVALHPRDIAAALRAIGRGQVLGPACRAVHAAMAWSRDQGPMALREDVGRHNALDKLVGALARAGADAGTGTPVPEIVVITSRVSVEMVQKAAVLGAPVLVAISAPTTLAIATAEAAGMTLVAVARDDGFEIFTHPHRIRQPGFSRDVA